MTGNDNWVTDKQYQSIIDGLDDSDNHLLPDQILEYVQQRVANDDEAEDIEAHLFACGECLAEYNRLFDYHSPLRNHAAVLDARFQMTLGLNRLRTRFDHVLEKLTAQPEQIRSLLHAWRERFPYGPKHLITLAPVTHLAARGGIRPGLMDEDDLATNEEANHCLIAPISTLVREASLFRWTPLPGAVNYTVYIDHIDTTYTIVSDPLTATEWVPPDPLRHGQSYTWSVAAELADGRIETTESAAFAVLDRDTEQEINLLVKQYSESPIALGGLYVEAGLLDDAEQAFEDVLREHPASKETQEVLSELNAFRGHGRLATE